MKYLFYLLLLTIGPQFLVAQQVRWLDWEQAVALNEKEPKKILVDVYTDWCGWCKKMDKSVFGDPIVAKYISLNFYAVKLNAEQKETIEFDGHTFKFKPDAGRRGAHSLAIAMLDGRMSYPSIVYFDQEQKRISISPGFKPADTYYKELQYIKGGYYKIKSFKEFLRDSK